MPSFFFTRGLAVGLAATAMAGFCALPASAANLVISNWDGYMAPDAVEQFKAATGVDAEVVVHATNEEIMGKLVASGGRGYDVVFVSSPFAEVLNNLGLAEPIDHSKVPNLANLYPEANNLPHDPGNTFQVPYTWGTTGLCHRADLVAETPDSWNDLLQPSAALTGKTTMLATDRWLLAAGQLALGQSVNETDPAKLEDVKNPSSRRRLCSPTMTPPSTPSSSRARHCSSRLGMAGATTASPRTPTSNMSSPPRVPTSGSTPWL